MVLCTFWHEKLLFGRCFSYDFFFGNEIYASYTALTLVLAKQEVTVHASAIFKHDIQPQYISWIRNSYESDYANILLTHSEWMID